MEMDLASVRGPNELAKLYKQSPDENRLIDVNAKLEMWIGLNDRQIAG